MQILIKALNGRQFKMDLDPEKTVLDLKEEIHKNEGADYNVESQKLIYEGKILVNSNKLSEYNIDAKKFLVLLITRPPPPPKKVEDPVPSTATSTASKKEDANKSDKNTKDETKSTRSAPAVNWVRQSYLPTPPPSSNQQQPNAPQQNPNPARGRTSNSSPTRSADVRAPSTNPPRDAGRDSQDDSRDMASRLSQFMNMSHFANLQSTLHQNPHLLSSTIESLSAVDPEMYEFVSENPDLFLNALNTAPSAGAHRSSSGRQRRSEPASRAQALVTGGGGSEQIGISQMLPSATDHDKQAIERLKELGFSEFQAIQAYVACDKDEQLAANLLFSMDQ